VPHQRKEVIMAPYTLFRPWGSGSSFDDLRREMDALFRQYGSGTLPSARGAFPAVNLYETADAYVLTAELPGVRPEEIHIGLEGQVVTLHGERRIEYPADEKTSVHRIERQSGAFRRAFELPVGIDADKAEAVHRNGVLMLHLPKAPEHRPRQISVQGG
jgi:HSP20 family protein